MEGAHGVEENCDWPLSPKRAQSVVEQDSFCLLTQQIA